MKMNELKLSKDIFEVNAIENAILQYKDICIISKNENSDYYTLIFSDCVYSVEETINEFENYVIDLMNS